MRDRLLWWMIFVVGVLLIAFAIMWVYDKFDRWNCRRKVKIIDVSRARLDAKLKSIRDEDNNRS